MDLVPYGVFSRNQVLSIGLGHIVVFLDWYAVVDPEILSHDLASIYPHILHYIPIYFQPKAITPPPHLLKLHGDF